MDVTRDSIRPSPAGSWRPLLMIMLLAIAGLACNFASGGSGDSDALPIAPVPDIRPEVALPDGWSMEEAKDGTLIVAIDAGDLDEGNQPAGPRLIVKAGQDNSSDPKDLVDEALDDMAAVESTQMIAEPAVIDLGKGNGVAITLSQGDTIRRIVFVNLGQGQAFQIVAEAPAEQWETHAAQLETLIGNVRFLSQ